MSSHLEPASQPDGLGRQPAPGAWFWGPFSQVCLWTALLTFGLDQSHKWWMLAVYQIKERGRVHLTSFCDLVLVINKGVSYGLLAWIGPWHLAGFALATAIGLWIWQARAGTGPLMGLSLGLIIGGALANALDRLLHGGVVDYVSLHAFGYYWYVFNIADAAIVAGVIGLLYDSWWTSRNDASNAA